MVVLKLISQITFLLLIMFQSANARAPAPIAQPKCRKRSCGNISIPYPFGIGKDCYMEKSFDIKCDETSNPPRAFISRIDKELVDISFERGAVVKFPVISFDSSGRQEGGPVDLTGTPFMFSLDNYFIAVGCNARANLWTDHRGSSTEHMGCDAICLNGSSSTNHWLGDGACSGKDCCQDIFMPFFLQVFNSSLDQQRRDGGTQLAFLAEKSWFDRNVTSPQQIKNLASSVPVALNWILNNTSWTYNENTMDCDVWPINSTTVATFNCSCSKGYEGNPYLNCTDINECDEDRNPCHGWTRCVNVDGSYECEPDTFWITIQVVGLAIGLLLLLIVAWWIYKLIKKRKCIRLRKKLFKRNGGLLLQQQLSSSDGSVQKTRIFSSKELAKATDYFSANRILGQGGQGTVYKGMLADGRIVAVKNSMGVDEGKLEEFINEVVILSQINHRNVVKLLGCCLETEVPILVYEFIPNGTLSQYLHDQNEDFSLPWETRLRIATEAAGAISYLHSAASIPIYHRDIKSTNILLDEKYRAKVSDFGTSRSISIDQTHLTTRVQGTFGYLDPEYFRTSQFTEKSDVYSFGVVLVELLSGQKPIFLTHSRETMSLVTHFNDLMEENRFFDVLDAQVKEHCTEEEFIVIANLAKRCLNLNGRNRPTMREVATELEGILLSRKGIHIQQNGEADENFMAEVTSEWDNSSTSITYCSIDM